MKNFFLLCLISIILMACGGSSSSTVVPSTATGDFSMKIDGTVWSANTMGSLLENNVLTVQGLNPSNADFMSIVIYSVKGVGTYKANGYSLNIMSYLKKSTASSYNSTDGSVTITSVKTVSGKQVPSGTFSGTFINKAGLKLTITAGKF